MGLSGIDRMRKTVGSKSQYFDATQIDELVQLHIRFEETPESKIFPIEMFGYRQITINRPLRLAFQVTPDRINVLMAEEEIQKLDSESQSRLIDALDNMNQETVYMNRSKFVAALKLALNAHSVYPGFPLIKLLLKRFGERNYKAEVCMNRDEPEPDPMLRNSENVPLGESV